MKNLTQMDSSLMPRISSCLLMSFLFLPLLLISQTPIEDSSDSFFSFSFEIGNTDQSYSCKLYPFPNESRRPLAEHRFSTSEAGEYYIYFENGLYLFDGKTYAKLKGPQKSIYHVSPYLFYLSPNLISVSQYKFDSLSPYHSPVFITLGDTTQARKHSHEHLLRDLPGPLSHISQFRSNELLLTTREEALFILSEDAIRKIEPSIPLTFAETFRDFIIGLSATDSKVQLQKVVILDKFGKRMWSSPPLAVSISPVSTHFFETPSHVFIVYRDTTEYTKIYSLPLDKDLHSSKAIWRADSVLALSMALRFPTQEGVFFSSKIDKNRFLLVSPEGFKESPFYNTLSSKLYPQKILNPVTPTLTKRKKWFLTTQGMLSVEPKQKRSIESLGISTVTGLIARGMDFQNDSIVWISSYTGIHKFFFRENDSLLAFPPRQTDSVSTVFYSLLHLDSVLLAATETGLYSYDISTRECRITESNVKIKDHLFSLLRIDSTLLLGTGSGILSLPVNSPLSAFRELALIDGKKKLPPLYVHRIKRHAASDTLFVCTQKGLYIVRLSSGSIMEARVLEKVLDESVHDAHLLFDGSLLLATQSSGLIWLDSTANRNVNYTFSTKNHLKSDYTHNIQQDGKGRIWLGSNEGLYLIDFDQRRVHPFGQKEGFPDDEFNRLSSAQSPGGLLAFGGVNGIGVFDPLDIHHNYSQTYVRVTSMWGKRVDNLVPLLPAGVTNTTSQFKVPKNIHRLRPVFIHDHPLQPFELYYRTDSNHFWQEAPDNYISVDPHSQEMDIQLLWQSPEATVFHSQMRLLPSEKEIPSYVYFFMALLLLLLAGLQFRTYLQQKKRSYPLSFDTEEAQSLITIPASDASVILESKDIKKPLSPLERLQVQLKKKEEEEYSFPETISSVFLADLKSVIEEYVGKNEFDVKFVAHQLNISPRQFHRKVVTATGLTPNQLFTLFKMKKAKSLIFKNTDLRNIQLAEKVGYINASYFSSKFKEMYGLTPKALATRIDKISRGDYYGEEE